ncbi:sigma-54-dependent transcriptional regulator [Shimia sagamensis]|uniref:Two-component system, NtrC family, C4-dicarboxylate transport response regulator DctD/two-component system, response regulator AauR n=1 Tax=Shimia sagamensis TaxID=1566352 RepID=A0ABY1NLG5_9RHOB|nr:sigma-54 dependent transcriptional regulator [Shimia sagamensis]SMP12709.1 two-component system, NtrC family, C4-dicarboxylate transport response regulator DctD/two-component system, response regulator AauR [Shimia sagamensis]
MSDAQPFGLLIVDDDKSMRQSLLALMQAAGWQAEAVPRADKALEKLGEMQPDVILSDVRMPGMSGLELLAQLDRDFAPPLVLISAHGDIPMAVEAMQAGAYSFVEKPYEPRRLLTILTHAAEQSRMKASNVRLKERLFALSGLDRVLLGQTPSVTALREEVLDLSGLDAAVLILGETGTGKELVARALHDLSARSDRPFLAVNCAALHPDSFEAEMFGVSGGPEGRLQTASGGTLFLDEVGSCPPAVQAKLLRVIEDQRVYPVGSGVPVNVDLRILSATNEDVDQAVSEDRLRADLLFRLNTFVVQLPPLRQRRDDLSLLASHFLNEYARMHEVDGPELRHEDMAALLAHDWPGNVRELRNVCARRVMAARRGGGSFASALAGDLGAEDVPDTLREAVAAFERELIGKAIKAHAGRMDAAAEALGIGRRTLNEKIVKLGLNKDALL